MRGVSQPAGAARRPALRADHRVPEPRHLDEGGDEGVASPAGAPNRSRSCPPSTGQRSPPRPGRDGSRTGRARRPGRARRRRARPAAPAPAPGRPRAAGAWCRGPGVAAQPGQQQVAASRPRPAQPVLDLLSRPGLEGHVETDHGHPPPGREHDRRGLGIGGDVELGGRGDVPPGRRAAHDHEVGDLADQRAADGAPRARCWSAGRSRPG